MAKEESSKGFRSWIEERTGLLSYWKKVGETPVTGGSRWYKALTLCLILFILIQFVTGMALLLKYSPTPETAHASVIHIQEEVALGSLIRGLHHWGASILMILLGLYLLVTLVMGGYKKPREISYWSLLVIAFLLIGMAFTGNTLPWNQRGYWGSVVVISSIEHAPIIGSLIATFLRGGDSFGAATLSTLSALHTTIIPVLLLLALLIHWIAFRRIGPVSGWDKSKTKVVESYSPGQFFKDAVVFVVIFIALFGASLFFPPSLDSPADTLHPPTAIKPEWYFLWMYYGVRFAQGNLAIVAEFFAPVLLLIFFVILPFLDRGEEKNPLKRWKYLAVPMLVFISIAVLTIAAMVEGSGAQGQVSHRKPTKVLTDTERAWARETFADKCSGCHGKTGLGDGQILKYREELRDHLPVFNKQFFDREEDVDLVESVTMGKPKHVKPPMMPAFGDRLSKKQIETLVAYLRTEYGSRSTKTGAADDWGRLDEESYRWASDTFQAHCIGCHGESGKGDGSILEFRPELKKHLPIFNSSFFAHESLAGLERSVTVGIPRGADKPRMPAFGKDFSSGEIQKLVTFLYTKFGKN